MTRTAFHFFALAAALLLVRGLVAGAAQAPPSVVVTLPRDAGPEASESAIQDALWWEEGRRLGDLRADPLVRDRLIRNLRFTGLEGADEALLEQALALGMHRTDPVVRARLVRRAQAAVDA